MKTLIKKNLAGRVAACGVAVALAAGCGGSSGSSKPSASTGGSTSGATSGASGGSTTSGTGPSSTAAGGDTTGTPTLAGGVPPVYPAGQKLPAYTGNLSKYTNAMTSAQSHGMAVWIESDLVKQWLAGPDQFTTAVAKITAEVAAVPDVVGVKIADELGKDTGSTTTPDQALQFLHDARAALHANVPGKLVIIDVIGYQLGCVPGNSSSQTQKCEDLNASQHSPMTLDTIDKIVKNRRGVVIAMLVRPHAVGLPDNHVALLWNDEKRQEYVQRLYPDFQVWVHVDYPG